MREHVERIRSSRQRKRVVGNRLVDQQVGAVMSKSSDDGKWKHLGEVLHTGAGLLML